MQSQLAHMFALFAFDKLIIILHWQHPSGEAVATKVIYKARKVHFIISANCLVCSICCKKCIFLSLIGTATSLTTGPWTIDIELLFIRKH